MKRKAAFWALFLASLGLFCLQTMEAFGLVAFHAQQFEKKPVILIDPGHGGEDGGAVGGSGLLEKDVNLAVSLALAEDLKAAGWSVVMTRDTDQSLGDPSLPTIAQRKSSDIRNRVRLAEEAGDCVLLSIHQNKFEESQYSGAQMFYSPNHPESAALAECLRKSVVSTLQPGNTRQCKEAGENVYLMAHVEVPAVLVECGFLSNPEEERLLADPEYQKEMAAAIRDGLLAFLAERDI